MINKLAYLIRTTCTSIYTVEKVDLSLCFSVSVCLSLLCLIASQSLSLSASLNI